MDVALVGRERPGDENLALRYLAAALRNAGHRAQLVPLNGPTGLSAAVNAVEQLRPGLVGLSIPDADIAMDALAFVRLLRRRGYAGHVTCGGPLATLARREILARQPGIDSVVRQAGEGPLVELAGRLSAPIPVVNDLPGLSTRAGDGRPAPVAAAGNPGLRPLRAERLPRILGVPTARLLGSRGCPGRCAYCGPAALQEQALAEGLAAGLDRSELARRGVGGVRRRTPDDVADEAAELYHGREARFFVLLDDNLLAGDPRVTAVWVRELRRALERRRVGRTAWSLQVEARVVTDELTAELAALGVVRALVGVEALEEPGLERLGRPTEPGPARAAVERLRTSEIVVSLNSIVVHPAADAETIRAELEALAALRGVHFDALAMAVHPGTRVWRELWHAGELSGGTYAWRHELRDPVVGRFRSLLLQLRLRPGDSYGPHAQAHDVAVNLAVARRLGLDPRPTDRAARFRELLDGMNERRISILREALALAEASRSATERTADRRMLARRFRRELWPFVERLERLEAALERDVGLAGAPGRRFFRSALAASFLLLGTGAAGCYGSHDSDAAASSDGGVDGRAEDGGAPDHGGEDAEADDRGGGETDVAPDGCSDAWGIYADEERVHTLARAAGCPCERDDPDGGWQNYGLVTDSAGRVVDVCLMAGDEPIPDEVRSCYLEALAGEVFPCAADDECWGICYVILM
jgi:radical SAM superfamily enzyme YgiQ (UPF0313 family)